MGYHLASSGLFDRFFTNYQLTPEWGKRIADVLASRDNDLIPRVSDAGKIRRGKQTMHNGIRINLGSYYGPEYSRMLLESRGVHEPQEERVFMEVLKTLPPDACMIEMGAFWSFYSMWFQKELRKAVNYMVEPDDFNLGQGKRNFRLNSLKGTFIKAFVGKDHSVHNGTRTVSVDGLVEEFNIPFIHILHSDIQGFEYEMLLGASEAFHRKKLGYVFISTHSDDIHNKCVEFLRERNFLIIADADMSETYSQDGLIVARAQYFDGLGQIAISKKNVGGGK